MERKNVIRCSGNNNNNKKNKVTVDILTCHSQESAGVTNNINSIE